MINFNSKIIDFIVDILVNFFAITGLKQTTLQFKPIKKGSKKKDSDDSDDIDFGSISPLPQPRSSRRAAGIGFFIFLSSQKIIRINYILIFFKSYFYDLLNLFK